MEVRSVKGHLCGNLVGEKITVVFLEGKFELNLKAVSIFQHRR